MPDEDVVKPKSFEELVTEELRKREELKKQFDHLVQTAQATPKQLHEILIANFTTKPKVNYEELALTWMQRSPQTWYGYHPEECQDVARYRGVGEDV